MNKLSFKKGRVKQKLQTRGIILEAVRQLMGTAKKISLEEVAVKAGISRATIYRYFTSIDILITEASLDIHHLSPNGLYEEVKELPLNDRIYTIQKYYNQLAQEHELGFRRYLSVVLAESITSTKKIRGARRIKSMKKALQPFKNEFSKEQYNNLINVSAMLMGIDSLIVAKDVCGLNNEESNAMLKWGIEMILKGMESKK